MASQDDMIQQRLIFDRSGDDADGVEEGMPEDDTLLDVSDDFFRVESYTVSELTGLLQELIEQDPVLGNPVIVRGELSNVSRSSRGHVYFTLKDDNASMKAVIWAGSARKLDFDLEDGLDVYVTGHLEVYAPYGTYSIVTQKIEPVGIGALQLAFQQIKERLEAQGFFLPEFKKPLPLFPQRIGIVTSRTGAVIHDMLRVIRRKNPLVEVLLAPVTVQGQGAADDIAAAIEELNRPEYHLDVLIVGRGGGSFEDLFCFNEESVVKAIFNSTLPVITGIGHEPDYSLADAAADYSASTPTAAAEKAVWDYDQTRDYLNSLQQHLTHTLNQQLLWYEQQFDHTVSAWLAQHQAFMDRMTYGVNQLQDSLLYETSRTLQQWEQRLAAHSAELDALSPLKTLARGYAIVSTEEGDVLHSTSRVQTGDRLKIRLSDGTLHCEVHHVDS